MLQFIIQEASKSKKALIHNVNIHAMNTAWRKQEYADILNQSEIVFCDGMGVKWGARLMGIKLKERTTPLEWIDDLFKEGEKRHLSFYFLGDEEPVVQRFIDQVVQRHPNVNVAGHHHGYFRLKSEEDIKICNHVNRSKADIILIGMGMPRQEIWGYNSRPRLEKGILIATGALFRQYIGFEKECPRWMSRSGMQWLWRFIHDPLRLFKRYVIENLLFMGRVLVHFLFKPEKRVTKSADRPETAKKNRGI